MCLPIQMKQSGNSLFLQLMRVALGNAEEMGVALSDEEWVRMMDVVAKQGVTGIAFSGVEKLPKAQMPPLEVIMDWSAVVDYTERENRRLNDVNVKVCRMIERDGKRACIIKGASIGVMYPESLRRSVGDVDVWMAGGYKAVSEYVMGKYPDAKGDSYGHHFVAEIDDVSVEVHFLPAELYNICHNRYLRKYYRTIEAMPWNGRARLENGDIVVPEPQVTFVIVVVHLFHHWAFEGIGMKQVVDCYWLLKYVDGIRGKDTNGKGADEIRAEVMAFFRKVGIGNFVAALMYVLQQLGLEKTQMLCVPDAKLGERLLDDIFATGIVSADELAMGKYGHEGKLHKFFRRLRRVMRMMPMAPSEMPWVMLKNIWGWMLGRTK